MRSTHATSSAQFAIDPLHRASPNAEACRNLAHSRPVLSPKSGLYSPLGLLVYVSGEVAHIADV
jgi:hypothetical protein